MREFSDGNSLRFHDKFSDRGGESMEIEVERDNMNPLLKRRELYLMVRYENSPTPSRKAVREKIAGLFNVDLDRIVVSYMKPQFGKSEAVCYVKIYNSSEDLLKTEPKYVITRNFEAEEGEGEEEGEA